MKLKRNVLSLRKAIELQLRLLCFMDTSRHNEFKPLDEIVFKVKYVETIEYGSDIDIGDIVKKLITELEMKKYTVKEGTTSFISYL